MNSPLNILADLPSLGINPNEWTTGLSGSVGAWIAGGVGLGVVILGVKLGFSYFRRICDPDYGTFYEGYTYEDWIEDSAEHYVYEQKIEGEMDEYQADLGDAAFDAVEADAEFGEFAPAGAMENIDPDDLVRSDDLERMTDAEIEELGGEGAAGTDSLVDDTPEYGPEDYVNPKNHPDDPSQEVF